MFFPELGKWSFKPKTNTCVYFITRVVHCRPAYHTQPSFGDSTQWEVEQISFWTSHSSAPPVNVDYPWTRRSQDWSWPLPQRKIFKRWGKRININAIISMGTNTYIAVILQWRHMGVKSYQVTSNSCFFKSLFKLSTKHTSKLSIIYPLWGGIHGWPMIHSQKASDADSVSMDFHKHCMYNSVTQTDEIGTFSNFIWLTFEWPTGSNAHICEGIISVRLP